MYRNNFWLFFAKIWPKKITSRDGCVLLIFGGDEERVNSRCTVLGPFWGAGWVVLIVIAVVVVD